MYCYVAKQIWKNNELMIYIFGYKNCCRNEKLHAHVNNVCKKLCIGV